MSTITDTIGRILAGRYRVEAIIGTGASAHVFAASDVTLKRRVAVKVLHPALANDAGFLRRFRAEAQAAAALNHPHIVAVFDWGEDDGSPFLVLEYLGGGSLRDLLDADRLLTVEQAIAVGSQAAEALVFAHARGVVHRDVKPANLLFDAEGRLAVADFGLARALSEAAWTEPVGATVGTARYASPEQAIGRAVDGRGDVYALALVLYETVTGTVPFTTDTTLGTLMARVGATLPGDERLGPLADILLAATATDPGERLDSAGLLSRLRALAATVASPAPLPLAGIPSAPPGLAYDRTELGIGLGADAPTKRRAGGSDPLAMAEAVGVAADPEVVSTWRPAQPIDGRRRRRWPWIAAVVVLILAIAGAAGAEWAVKNKVFTPSHRVPSITGLAMPAATAKVAHVHDRIRVVAHRSSLTVASGVILRQIPAAHTSVKDGTVVGVVLSSGPPPVPVPSLSAVAGSCAAFTQALAARHLHAVCTSQSSTTVPAGHAISWSPDTTALEDSTVAVVVSTGPPVVTIPSLSGITTCSGVSSALSAVGLKAACSTAYASSPAGSLVSEQPPTQATLGTTVTVVLSQGPPPVVVPDVANGDTLSQAISTLQSAGLVAGVVYGPAGGTVFYTSPAAGASVPRGTSVTLYTQP
jgi:serine/threonine protein kinase/beta-lactam-binding protein with PASTA domain